MVTTKYINRPLGMGNSFAPSTKQWVATAIGAGLSIGSSLFGAAASKRAEREARRKQAQMEAKENAWYQRRYNEDYLDTAAGSNLVRRAKDIANAQWKKAAGAQAVAGGTDAATQMAKDAGNKMVGDTIADIAAADTQRKAQVDNIHMGNEQRFAQMDIERANQKASNITQAAGAASNAIMQVAGAVEQMPASNKPNLMGGSNNSIEKVSSTPVTTPVAPNAVTEAATQGGNIPTLEEQKHFRDAVGQ